MVLRKKNLLDAFRQATPQGRQPAPASSPSPAGAKDPFAPVATGAPRVEPVVSGEPAANAQVGPESLFSGRRLRAVVIVATVIGLGGYFAGRFAAKPTRAAGDPAPGSVEADPATGALSDGRAAGENLVERNQAAARMGSAVDKAFMDPANRFTIRLIQYKNDAAGQQRAQETAEYLAKQAIPVVSPISLGKNVILCADAKPRTEDLARLLKHVKQISGPPPQSEPTPYSSAYVVNIDDVVKRR